MDQMITQEKTSFYLIWIPKKELSNLPKKEKKRKEKKRETLWI